MLEAYYTRNTMCSWRLILHKQTFKTKRITSIAFDHWMSAVNSEDVFGCEQCVKDNNTWARTRTARVAGRCRGRGGSQGTPSRLDPGRRTENADSPPSPPESDLRAASEETHTHRLVDDRLKQTWASYSPGAICNLFSFLTWPTNLKKLYHSKRDIK